MIRTAAIFLTLWLSLLSGSAFAYNPGGGETNADLSSFDYSQPQSGDISHTSGYDNLGNVIHVVETYSGLPGRDVLNSYDRTNRLVTEQDTDSGHTTLTSYTYTENNSRYDRTVRVDTGPYHTTRFRYGNPNIGYNSDQLYGISKLDVNAQPGNDSNFKYRYTYDADGNRATRVTDPGTSSAKTDTYTYDQHNRLISVASSNFEGAIFGTSSYTYDERTRRTRTDEGGVSSVTRRLSFSGGSYVQEYGAATGVLPSLQLVRGSDMGGGVGGILYNDGSAGVAFNNYNSRGDVVSQTNTGGASTWTGKYDAFGTHTDSSTTSAVGRQRANSKDEDPTGLLNEGMRYRDLEAGLFLTRDPAGLVDGPNVYTYVNQNPWTKFDPTGLNWEALGKAIWNLDLKGIARQFPVSPTGTSTQDLIDGATHVVDTASGSYNLARGSGDGVVSSTYQSVAVTVGTVSGVRDVTEGITGAEMNYSGGNTGTVDDISEDTARRIDKTVGGSMQVVATAFGLKGAGESLGRSARSTAEAATEEVSTTEGSSGSGRQGDSFSYTQPEPAATAAKKPTGSYTNTHESGNKYHGKGTEERMNISAKEKATEYGDPVVAQDFKPAADSREAFKDEARRIREDGGVENPNNYNKINSPGEKYLKQDGE